MKLRSSVLTATLLGTAAGLAAYVWTPKTRIISSETHEDVHRVSAISADAGIRPQLSIPRKLPTGVPNEPLTIQNAAARAREGDREALKFVSQYFHTEFQKRGAGILRDDDAAGWLSLKQDIVAELGISYEEFETLDDADSINQWLDMINGTGIEKHMESMREASAQLIGVPDEEVPEVMTNLKFFQLFMTICEEVSKHGPYNPALLRALKMDEAQFRDLVQEVYIYMMQRPTRKEDQQAWLDYLASLYGFTQSE